MSQATETRFGHYRLLQRLGAGGMAEVFRARIAGRAGRYRDVAIKRLLPQLSDDAELITMFTDEARLSRQLDHPGIARVYESGTVDGSLFIAMEYIAGKDLCRVARACGERPMPVGMVLQIGAAVADALGHAHGLCDADGQPLNVVHRDVSPQNILVSYSGVPKLIDFGIAKARVRLQHTMGGVIKGKFAYMSPEQIKGGDLDGRSDLFALGIVLFELLAATDLFCEDNDLRTITNILEAPIPSLRGLNPEVPGELEGVVHRALARSPEQRFQSAGELREALLGVGARSPSGMMTQGELGQWMVRTFPDEAAASQPLRPGGGPPIDDTLQDDRSDWSDDTETEPDPRGPRRRRAAAQAPPSEEVATALLQRPPGAPPLNLPGLPTIDDRRPPLTGPSLPAGGGPDPADPFAGEDTKTSPNVHGFTDPVARRPRGVPATALLLWIAIGLVVCVGSGVIAYFLVR